MPALLRFADTATATKDITLAVINAVFTDNGSLFRLTSDCGERDKGKGQNQEPDIFHILRLLQGDYYNWTIRLAKYANSGKNR